MGGIDPSPSRGNIGILVKAALPILLVAATAHAATVRGTITLPAEPRTETAGHWRVENGVLPITPRPLDLKNELVVLLESAAPAKEKDPPAPPTVTVELRGLRAESRLVVAPPGATVQFKNADRVPHTLYAEAALSVLAPETTPAGATRSQKFDAVGEYHVRDQEYPHIETIVLITKTPFYASADDKGAFKMEAPEGKYTLRIYWRGAWVVSQPLDVGPRTTDVSIQVPSQKRADRARSE
jgi:plastocyanin